MANTRPNSANTMISLLAVFVVLLSCNKGTFLDKKPNTNLVVPATLTDFQALLDNGLVMDFTPVLGELSADNFYVPYSFWQTINTLEHSAYIWSKDIYGGQGQVQDWDNSYSQVFYANVVLAGLPAVPVNDGNQQQWNALKGAALFIRSYAFFNVAQLFAPAYDSLSGVSDLGIPLRLEPNINIVSTRSTVQQTYSQILADLKDACNLLPDAIPYANRNRPSRPAAMALLARVFLSMRAYHQAGLYADSCLHLYNTLIDFNKVDTGYFPFTNLNAETMYQSSFLQYTQVLAGAFSPYCIVDSGLYRSYNANDLRRKIFYRINSNNDPNGKENYSGGQFPFSGLATDEVYLISAESAARAGNTGTALSDLNMLLTNRWVKGTFNPITQSSPTALLDTVLVERRKELAFRGLRWTDLRRLNKEGARDTLRRVLNGTTYQLLPNDPLYVLPIPPDVISLSGIQQNPR